MPWPKARSPPRAVLTSPSSSAAQPCRPRRAAPPPHAAAAAAPRGDGSRAAALSAARRARAPPRAPRRMPPHAAGARPYRPCIQARSPQVINACVAAQPARSFPDLNRPPPAFDAEADAAEPELQLDDWQARPGCAQQPPGLCRIVCAVALARASLHGMSQPGGPPARGVGCRAPQHQRAFACAAYINASRPNAIPLSVAALGVIQVLELCAELELDRSELLTWMKRNGKGGARPPLRAAGAPPPAPKPAPPARSAASVADDVSPFAAVPAGRPGRGARDAGAAAAGDKAAPKRMSKEAFHAKLPSNVPYWKSFTKPRLGRHQTDTLERVYQNNRFPTVRPSDAAWLNPNASLPAYPR